MKLLMRLSRSHLEHKPYRHSTPPLANLAMRFRCNLFIIGTLMLGLGGGYQAVAGAYISGQDPETIRILEKAVAFYSGLQALQVKVETALEATPLPPIDYALRLTIVKPNKISLEADESGVFRYAIASDGQKLQVYFPELKKCLDLKAPVSLFDESPDYVVVRELIERTVPMVQTLAGPRAMEDLMEGVESAEYAGIEDIMGTACHRLRFKQKGFDWDLWIENGDSPWMRKLAIAYSMAAFGGDPTGDGNTNIINMAYLYKDWTNTVDETADTFHLSIPDDVEHVTSWSDLAPPSTPDEAMALPPLLGELAPDAVLSLLDGTEITLNTYRGAQVVVLDFWATWCLPCREGLPGVQKVSEELADKGVVFYAVNQRETKDTVEHFLKNSGLQIQVAMDDGTIGDLFEVNGIPHTVIIDKKGIIQSVQVGSGPGSEDLLRSQLEAVLVGEPLAQTLLAAAENRRHAEPARYTPQTIPRGEMVSTQEDWDHLYRNRLRETLVEAYKKEEKKDERIIGFLEDYCERILTGYVETFTELRKAAQRLVDEGADDPLFLYTYANLLRLTGRTDESTPIYEACYEKFMEHPLKHMAYNCALHLADRERLMASNETTWRDRALALLVAEYAQAFSGAPMRTVDAQLLYKDLSGPLKGKNAEAAAVLNASPDVDPLIKELALGSSATENAWLARGTGWANTVSNEGWKGFGEHLAVAREHLTKTWEMDPTLPQAAKELIPVAMGDGEFRGETRMWFDRAVAAQMDYASAYSSYRWAIRPRWGGSRRQLMAFGTECLETKMFNTRVPREYLLAVRDVGKDLDYWRDAFKGEDVYARLTEMCEGYLAQRPSASDQVYYRSLYAIIAWCCEDYAKARELLDTLNRVLSPSALEHFADKDAWVDPDLVIAESYLLSGPQESTFRAAREAAQQKKYPEAIALHQEILSSYTLPEDDFLRTFIRGEMAPLQLILDMEGGQWVSLFPQKDLYGWQVKAGQWEVTEAGALIGRTRKDYAMIFWNAPIGANFEMKGTLQLTEKGGIRGSVLFNADSVADNSYTVLRISKHSKNVYLKYKFSSAGQLKKDFAISNTNAFHLIAWDNHVSVYINGEKVFDREELPKTWRGTEDSRIGFGDYFKSDMGEDYVIRYLDMQIRYLEGSPPEF